MDLELELTDGFRDSCQVFIPITFTGIPPAGLVEVIGGEGEVNLLDGLGNSIRAVEFSGPELGFHGDHAVVLTFVLEDDVPAWAQGQQGVFPWRFARADAIADAIGGFLRLSLLVEFSASFQSQVGKAGDVDEWLRDLDELIPAMRQSPIGQTAAEVRSAYRSQTRDVPGLIGLFDNPMTGVQSTHTVREQMNLLSAGLLADLFDLSPEF